MTAACKSTGIGAEVCSDIFTAIEKGKTRVFSCVIVDWADQPEASFLLRRARESASNRETVAIAIVDHDPTPAELRDNRLDFLIYRPISAGEAAAVLAKASEQMQPLSEEDAASSAPGDASQKGQNAGSTDADETEHNRQGQSANFPEENTAEDDGGGVESEEEEPQRHGHAIWFRKACAAALVLTAAFYLWRSRDTIEYLSRTREGRFRVLQESVAALISRNQTDDLTGGPAGGDAEQDSYFRRAAPSSNAQTPALEVVATESTQIETRLPLPKASDFPLPVPLFVHQDAPPIQVARAAIPESMKSSAPIERPVVVTVTPGQMMPVSAPQLQPAIQQFSEPVALSEEAARALLVHSVNPVYPPEALAQKLHGAVVLQAVIGRGGNVEDLKIVRGYFVLGRAAISAVKQWKFQPYSVNGQAAATQTVITINFSYPPG
ncbi:MAG: TonB family protein [Terriglobales bacterium]